MHTDYTVIAHHILFLTILSIVVLCVFVFVLALYYQTDPYKLYTIRSVITKTLATIGLEVMFYQTNCFHLSREFQFIQVCLRVKDNE